MKGHNKFTVNYISEKLSLVSKQPTEIKGRIAALSPNSPFLGLVSTSFSLFLLSEQLFVYFSPTFFFWKRFSHRFRSGFWIPNFSGFRIPDQCGFRIPVHWIPDSNIKNLRDSGFCYMRRKVVTFLTHNNNNTQ